MSSRTGGVPPPKSDSVSPNSAITYALKAPVQKGTEHRCTAEEEGAVLAQGTAADEDVYGGTISSAIEMQNGTVNPNDDDREGSDSEKPKGALGVTNTDAYDRC